MIIEQPAFFLRWLYPNALWRMDPNDHAVYLTFDDGPIPEVTPWVLDVLDQYNVKATFFMVGDNIRKYPEIFEEVRRRGHRLGNHTFNHISGHLHGISSYVRNVERANEYLHTDLFRPPHGWMKWPQYHAISRRYRVVMWDLVTRGSMVAMYWPMFATMHAMVVSSPSTIASRATRNSNTRSLAP